MKIEIIGLGSGDLKQMPIGIYERLLSASPLFLRTKDHPAAQELAEKGVSFVTFDDVYETSESFEETYETIVERLLEYARKEKHIVYAVPGHPLVAEKTVQILLDAEKEKKVDVEIVGGQSFLDAVFTSLEIDPIEGCQIVDAASVRSYELEISHHIIFVQVYDQQIASQVKLTLMERLPDDYVVKVVEAAGTNEEHIRELPLYELDRNVTLSQLRIVYVPPVQDESMMYQEFSKLREVVAYLRGPSGCPWDRKQTHESLKKYLIEEAEEVLEAIDKQDVDNLIEELGDVLLQVMMHAQIGEDEGYFSIDDVIRTLTEKLIRRHPHVFGGVHVENEEQLKQLWEEIKREEKQSKR